MIKESGEGRFYRREKYRHLAAERRKRSPADPCAHYFLSFTSCAFIHALALFQLPIHRAFPRTIHVLFPPPPAENLHFKLLILIAHV